METLFQDIRHAVRSLRSSRGFTVVTLLTLALGIGANTAIFSVVNAVLLRPLPYPEPHRLVSVGHLQRGEYLVIGEHARSLQGLALYQAGVGFNLSAGGEPERLTGAYTSPRLLATLGAGPLIGRGFAADETPSAGAAVMLSHRLWRQRFGGDPDIVGKEIVVDSEPREVVGVLPPGFAFPDATTDLWVPLTVDAGNPVALWGGGGGQAIARLAPGIAAEQAQQELRLLTPTLRAANTLWSPPPEYGQQREVVLLQDRLIGDVRTRLLLFLGAVSLLLLIACANVANLMLVRAAARQNEMGIRLALGAGRVRLVRQLSTESALLALAGGALGTLLAFGGIHALTAWLPPDTPRIGEVRIDGAVLGFTLGISMLTGLLFGAAPTLHAARTDPHSLLRRGGQRAGHGPGERRLSSALVAAEIALAVVLLVGAGLLIRSFVTLLRVDPGFRSEHLVSARVTPPVVRYGGEEQQRAFYGELIERARALPEIQGVAAIDRLPLEADGSGLAYEVEGAPHLPGTAAPTAATRRITPDYLRIMGIEVMRGRHLTEADRADAPAVAVINEAMARAHWPGEDAVGKRYRPVWWQDRWIEVVGVVRDVRHQGLGTEVLPEAYRPFAQEPTASMTIVLRGTGDPRAAAGAVAAVLRSIDREVPVSEVRTVEQVISESVVQPRVTMLVLGLFAGIALLLAAIGIYGIVSYTVGRRSHEMGVRMALGARGSEVMRLVLRHGARLAAVGLAIGTLAALALTRLMEHLLYGVDARDPLTFVVAAGTLLTAALLASYLPARRATRVDPMSALRSE